MPESVEHALEAFLRCNAALGVIDGIRGVLFVHAVERRAFGVASPPASNSSPGDTLRDELTAQKEKFATQAA